MRMRIVMPLKLLTLLSLMLSVTACSTLGTGTNPLNNLHCAGWKPINPSVSDTLTPGTRDQILDHDQYGAKEGCWSLPK